LFELSTLFLSRLQFAFVISFHIIFPAFTIGLASWLAVLEYLWLKTDNKIYKQLYMQWVKIFSVAFGMGVVSGVVMSYQFGTNWSFFALKTGNVLGPIMALEVLTAFFLEASFLGIMLFGWNKVGRKLHFMSTSLVAFGTLISAFWILSVNSWMQTPAGYRVDEAGIMHPTSWLEIIFNPSFLYRYFHMVLAAFLSTALVVAGVSAWYLLKQKYEQHSKFSLLSALTIIVLVAPLQIIAGHAHGVNTLEYQPVKVAAMEGIWENETGANLRLFGWPNEKTEKTEYSIEIPKLASLVLHGSTDATVKGLKAWPKEQRPPVVPVFFCFRIMVGIGLLMLLTGISAVCLYIKGTLFRSPKFLRWCTLFAPSGFVAILAGWVTTEVGRQPYIVYGLIATKDAVSDVHPYEVGTSLILFMLAYTAIFSAGIWYIFKLIRKGPLREDMQDEYGTHGLKDIPKIADPFLNTAKDA